MKKPLPIGISDFKNLIDGGYAYVDKTLLIQEIVEKGTQVALIPRLRRLGKTLNLSMLRYFFEKGEEDRSYLFQDLLIWQREEFRAMLGEFPVVFITLKDIKQASWEESFQALCRLIALEFDRHSYLEKGETLSPKEKLLFRKILFEEEKSKTLFEESLFYLSTWLHRFHKKKVILLIDEYDTPAHAAHLGGYYNTMISFLRNWLSGGLKDNHSLERAVMTGILRIAKESIFSGLNHVSTFTLLNEDFRDKFGLLESEVNQLLKEHGFSHFASQFRDWYDGYQMGSCAGIYNPWSVLKCIQERGSFAPYWVNTSDNALVEQLITKGGGNIKTDIEELVRGGTIEKKIEEGIVFPEWEKGDSGSIWALLLFSGYLTLDATPSYGTPCRLRIPNLEVRELYDSMILDWFEKSIDTDHYLLLLNSLIAGDIDTFSQIFQNFLT